MKKAQSYFFIIIFLVMLIGPNVLNKIVGNNQNIGNSENRKLAEKPIFSMSKIEEFPKQYEAYFNDHIPFKTKYINLNQQIMYHIFGIAENEKCVMGKNNWLFFKENGTLEDYQGISRFSEAQILNLVNKIQQVNDYFNSADINLVISIIPNKESIYGEYLPDKYTQFADYTRADQIYDYLKNNTNITVISPKKEMRNYKNEYQLYYKYDTHWNAIGAYIATNASLSELGYPQMAPIEEITIKEEGSHVGDLAEMLKLTNLFYDEPLLGLSGFSDTFVETIYSKPHSIVFNKKFISDSDNEEKIYIVGDSFSAEYAEYLKFNFEECTVIHREEYEAGLAENEGANIVICEFVERYIDQIENMPEIFIP